MSEHKRHILVIRLSAMGDVAMTIPVLKALLEQNTGLNITILTKSFYTPLFKGLNEVKVYPVQTNGKHKGIYGLYKLARKLNKKHRFYAIADLHNVLRSKVLKQFLNCRRFISIDKGRSEKRALVSGDIFKPLKTTHERYADVFRGLGYQIDLSNPTFPKPIVLSQDILNVTGVKSGKWIGIAPFAAHESKMYPLEQMKKVISGLEKDYKILLFGGGDKEIHSLSRLEKEHNNTINLAGKLSFDQELDIISNLDCMISMDSGNGHIAATLGVKVVTIWGVTHPYAGFAPFNQPEDYSLLADRDRHPKIPTSVYGNKYPKGYENVASSIAPEVIVEKVKKILFVNKKGQK